MYVMYKPDYAGVTAQWVALAKIQWGWSADAAKGGDGLWRLISATPQTVTTAYANPGAGQTQMGQSDYFPSWTDRITDVVNRPWM